MTEQLKCDLGCGRNAIVQVAKRNLCEQCAVESSDADGPGPRLRLEDVVTTDRPMGDEVL